MSWNEFLYQMLAKGEVEQIIVRPDIDIVTILLHEGAIIKGRRVRVLHYTIYTSNVHFSNLGRLTHLPHEYSRCGEV